MTRLRGYQSEAVAGVIAALRQHRSTLIVHPTGCGKTVVAGAIAEMARGRVLFLAPRGSLVTQTADRFRAMTNQFIGVEMAEESNTLGFGRIVCGTVQSMSQPERLSRYAHDYFSLVILDEAHHSTSKQYGVIVNHFAEAKVLGLTATPDRMDGTALLKVFESVAHVYDIRDAIGDGHLSPLRQVQVHVDSLDLSTLRVNGKTKDFSDKAIAEQLEHETALHEIAGPLVDLAGDRPTLVFVPRVATAKALAAVIARTIGEERVIAVDGSMSRDTVDRTLKDFRAGRVQYLVNAMLLTEGIDLPNASCIAMARPTKSRALYAQALGRGTRLSPDTGKVDCLIIDFVGNAGKHRLMCPANVLDGNTDADVTEAVRVLCAEDPDMPVHEALAEAIESVAAARRASLIVKARFRTVDVDPFAVVGASNQAGRWGGMPITEGQALALEKFGVGAKDIASFDKGQASELLDRLVQRSRSGLCTYKMARQLVRFGLVADVSFERARTVLDAIAANGWRAPAWLYSEPDLRVDDANCT